MSDAHAPHSSPSSVVPLPIGPSKMPDSIDMLLRKVKEAESLLFYAAEAGISVDEEIRSEILRAVSDIGAFSSPEAASKLLAGMTQLTQALRPVTAASLAACENGSEVNGTVRVYRTVAVILALLIVPISLITFVTTSISEATLKDITEANALAVKLTDLESSPKTEGLEDRLPREASVIRDLQTFAGTTRAVDARARQLNWFVLHMVEDPLSEWRRDATVMSSKFELDPSQYCSFR